MEPETKDDWEEGLRCIFCKELFGYSPWHRPDVICISCWEDLPKGPDFIEEDIRADRAERMAAVGK